MSTDSMTKVTRTFVLDEDEVKLHLYEGYEHYFWCLEVNGNCSSTQKVTDCGLLYHKGWGISWTHPTTFTSLVPFKPRYANRHISEI